MTEEKIYKIRGIYQPWLSSNHSVKAVRSFILKSEYNNPVFISEEAIKCVGGDVEGLMIKSIIENANTEQIDKEQIINKKVM